jgi:prepilin-type N-terminal cleavage/methylation domain-containing protein
MSVFKRQKGFTLLELLYAMSIVAILSAMLVPQLLQQKRRIVEVQAMRRLKSIGSVMTEYSLSHNSGDYADFQELKDANLISRDVTQTSLINDYSLAFRPMEAERMGRPAGFTVIAYPIPERSYGSLATFAITDDNVIRVYRPRAGVDPRDPDTWEPVL